MHIRDEHMQKEPKTHRWSKCLAQSVKEDETDCKPVATANVIRHSMKLVELFNFADHHWIQVYEKAVWRSFDEELELYELLDLDAEGEEEADVDVDDSTGELLIG